MPEPEILRKKYPVFTYDRFGWWRTEKHFKARFKFTVGQTFEFEPSLSFEGNFKDRIEEIGKETMDNLVFHLGLAEMPSYWKAVLSPEIRVEAGKLTREQKDFWEKLFRRGMGQFFYRNGVDFTKPNFLKITSSGKGRKKNIGLELNPEKVLLPIGGGKDSALSLELVKKTGKSPVCFGLEPTSAIKEVSRVGDCLPLMKAKRKISPALLRMNRKGFPNGHTPFSSYLAFLSALAAVLADTRFIAFSNERSANQPNLEWRGRDINHQYSKSFEFEKDFFLYSRRYLVKNLYYFSLLRPLYEVQIAKGFSRFPRYFDSFISCNRAFRTDSGRKTPSKDWCRECSKCLFVFASLYPFLKKETLLGIFGENLFRRKDLLPLARKMTGEGENKPWECVGTFAETRALFHLALKEEELPLLAWFESEIEPKYPELEQKSKRIFDSWNEEHNLPPAFKKVLAHEIGKD